MDRQKLRALLLEAGEGDPARIEFALRDPACRTLTAEEALVSAGAFTEERLAPLQAAWFGLPWVHRAETEPEASAVELVPRDQAVNYCLIPYRLTGQVARIGAVPRRTGVRV